MQYSDSLVNKEIENYEPANTGMWTGRIDDKMDKASYRIHQIIQSIDLNDLHDYAIDDTKLNICFLGYCSDEGVRRNQGRLGAVYGPKYIRQHLAGLPASFDDKTSVYDAGDLTIADGHLDDLQARLSMSIERLLFHGLMPIVLGGSHDLALGQYSGIDEYLSQKNTEQAKIGIINIDAHFDLRPYDQCGTSGTMFSQIADTYYDGQNMGYLCLGIQPSGNTQRLFYKAHKLGATYIYAHEMNEPNNTHIYSKINAFIDEHDYIYLTLCSDVFSPAYAPGVSSVQPLGLSPSLILPYLRAILKTDKVVSFDIAEVSPPLDRDDITSRLAATIIHTVISTLSERPDHISSLN